MSKEYARNLKRWQQRRVRMAEMRANGMTLDQIGRRFDITRQRVGQILRASHR